VFDPFTQDVPVNLEYPALTNDVRFESHGCRLNGVLLLAAGPGPHPLVVLLHGFPGNERNFDLAHLYRRAGLNVLVFHYRGSWGSEGMFSFANALEDVEPALEFCRTNASKYRIDPNGIALAGHSMGAWIALMHAARDSRIKAVISICAFNFGRFTRLILNNPESVAQTSSNFDGETGPLSGTGGSELVQEMLEHASDWYLLETAPGLASRPVMLIAAERDTVATLEVSHTPLVAELKRLGVHLEECLFDSDHSLASHRIALARATLAFLQAHV
jgi:uncharacterized protein